MIISTDAGIMYLIILKLIHYKNLTKPGIKELLKLIKGISTTQQLTY